MKAVSVATALALLAFACGSNASNGAGGADAGAGDVAVETSGPADCVAAGGQCVLGNARCANRGAQDCNPGLNPGGAFCCLSGADGGFDGGTEASVSTACAAAGGQCIAGGGVCWGVPTSAAVDRPALCGSPDAVCCLVVFDAGGCTDASATTVRASSYDQSCTLDMDCVGVSEGDSCNPCDFNCVNAAINAGALRQYTSDTANFPAVLAVAKGACPSSCGGPESTCCRGGTCQWGYPLCPYPGVLAVDAGDAGGDGGGASDAGAE